MAKTKRTQPAASDADAKTQVRVIHNCVSGRNRSFASGRIITLAQAKAADLHPRHYEPVTEPTPTKD